MAVIAGERAGIWKIAEPILIRDVCATSSPAPWRRPGVGPATQTESKPVSSASRTSSSWCSAFMPRPQ